MAVRMTWEEARRLIPGLDALLADGGDARGARRALAVLGCPCATHVEAAPGRWAVTVSAWRPASDNVRARGLKAWIRAKRADRAVVRDWVAGYAAVPRATGRRRLSVRVEMRGTLVDPQNCLKSLCDACVECGLLADDSAEFLELATPVVVRARRTATTLVLEDLP